MRFKSVSEATRCFIAEHIFTFKSAIYDSSFFVCVPQHHSLGPGEINQYLIFVGPSDQTPQVDHFLLLSGNFKNLIQV